MQQQDRGPPLTHIEYFRGRRPIDRWRPEKFETVKDDDPGKDADRGDGDIFLREPRIKRSGNQDIWKTRGKTEHIHGERVAFF